MNQHGEIILYQSNGRLLDSYNMEDNTINADSYHELLLGSGTLPPPVLKLEVPLYKYRSNSNHALDEIREQYVFTSYSDEQNDPFDSAYQMSYEEALKYKRKGSCFFLSIFSLPFYPCYNKLSNLLNECLDTEMTLEEFSALLSNAFESVGFQRSPEALSRTYYERYLNIVPRRNAARISCFSEIRDSIPMWAYYAHNHTGLCFKYDFSLLDNQIKYNQCILNSLHKVWYSNNKPLDPDGNYSYLVKANDWAHEQEWRLINWQSKDKISLPCMSEIYLGINSSIELMDSVIDAIKASGKKIALFKCRPNLREYKIEFVRINFQNSL